MVKKFEQFVGNSHKKFDNLVNVFNKMYAPMVGYCTMGGNEVDGILGGLGNSTLNLMTDVILPISKIDIKDGQPVDGADVICIRLKNESKLGFIGSARATALLNFATNNGVDISGYMFCDMHTENQMILVSPEKDVVLTSKIYPSDSKSEEVVRMGLWNL